MIFELLSIERLFFCIIEICMLYSFLASMFKKRLEVKKLTVVFLMISILIFLENSLGSVLLNLLFVPCLYLVFSICAFQISVSNGIVYSAIYYLIFAGSREAVFILLLRLLSEVSSPPLSLWFTQGGSYTLLVQYVLAFIFLLYIEKFTSRLNVNENNKFSWYLLILPISSIVILSCFVYIDFPESRLLQIFLCGGAFLLYFANAAIFVILEKFSSAMNQIKDTELYMMKKNMERINFENTAKINSVYREYMHDIRKYFSGIRSLALSNDTHKIINMIDELEGGLQKEESDVIYSGNIILNGILTVQRNKAIENGITMTIFVEHFLNVDFISDGDMISMFGNLLDNAIEAASKCAANRKIVNVKLFMGNDYLLVLQIENTWIGDVRKVGARLLTTKKNALGHGLGINIVKSLAEKYGGTLELIEKEDKFSAILMISTC